MGQCRYRVKLIIYFNGRSSSCYQEGCSSNNNITKYSWTVYRRGRREPEIKTCKRQLWGLSGCCLGLLAFLSHLLLCLEEFRTGAIADYGSCLEPIYCHYTQHRHKRKARKNDPGGLLLPLRIWSAHFKMVRETDGAQSKATTFLWFSLPLIQEQNI